MEELLKYWEIGDVVSVEPLSSFTGKVHRIHTKAGCSFILKEKIDQVKASREAALLHELAMAAAPVAAPMRTTTGDWVVLENGKVFLLYPQLHGEVIAEHYEGDSAARAEMYGKAIAELHGWLLKISSSSQFPQMQLPEQIRQWALPCCKNHLPITAANALEGVWGRLESDWNPQYEQLPHQLIHRDAHPGNMLFECGRLSGFIDFDQVMKGPRLFDLCYCGTSLLVGGFPRTEKRDTWPGLFRALTRGYQTVSPLSSIEREAALGMLIAIELLFVAFCLEGGEREAARQNERVVHWLAKNQAKISF